MDSKTLTEDMKKDKTFGKKLMEFLYGPAANNPHETEQRYLREEDKQLDTFIFGWKKIEYLVRKHLLEEGHFTAEKENFSDCINACLELSVKQKNRLHELRKFRNLLVHPQFSELGNYPVLPSTEVIRQLLNLLIYLEDNPTVLANFGESAPVIYRPQDSVQPLFDLVKDASEADKLLIRNKNGELDLVTANMFMVWAANHSLDITAELIANLKLEELLPYGESGDSFITVKPDTTIIRAMNKLVEASKGNYQQVLPCAVVITDNGEKSGTPQALCSRQRLYSMGIKHGIFDEVISGN